MTTQTDIAWVFGTRPELVKIASCVMALRERDVAQRVLATGQHTDLLDPALAAALGEIENLGVTSTGSILRFLGAARRAVRDALTRHAPRCVAVQGDTMSALVGALEAHDLGIPVAHIEAGVRSGTLSEPWPEELIRVAIDELATWRYAPTRHAIANLQAEGLDGVLTGNTSVDMLREAGIVSQPEREPLIVVTLHRRELRARKDVQEVLQAMFDALERESVVACWPLHPGMHEVVRGLRVPENVTIRPPMAYASMLNMLAGARGILTDSGGLVEEACALGVPCAILRHANDRPEAVEALAAQRFEPTPEGVRLAVQTLAVARGARQPSAAYGDGHAAERIAEHLASELRTLGTNANDSPEPHA